MVKHGANKCVFNISLENDYNQHLCSLLIVSVISSVFMSGLKCFYVGDKVIRLYLPID